MRAFSVVSAIALTAALAGCNPASNTTAASSNSTSAMAALAMPLTTGPETPAAAAPAASALPKARAPVRVVHVTRPQDNYAYVDRAYAMSDAFGDAPPDYGYDYGPTHLWAWRGQDRSVRLVEPVDGGDRYYYYRPGMDAPYLVRDYDNSYGYDDNGDLVVVYDRDGRPLPYPDRYADRAARELERARAVYAASLNSQRREVRAANWAARRSQIDAARSDWAAQAAREAEWRAYHDKHAAEEAAYWRGEQDRRAQEARAFDDWRRQDYRPQLPAVIGDRRGTQYWQQQALAQPHQQLAAQQASQQAHQQAEARLAALKRQQQAEAEEAQRKQLGAQLRHQQAAQQASAQAHQQAEARLAALKQQKQAEAEEARRKQLGAQQRQQQAVQQASAQAHQQAEARLAALKQQKQAEAEEARRKQLGAQQRQQQAAAQAHQQAQARQRQQLAEQQAQKEKVLAAQNQAHQQAAAHQKAHPNPPQNTQPHGQDHHPHKPGERHDQHERQ